MSSWYRYLARPLAFSLPPELAHELTLTGLRKLGPWLPQPRHDPELSCTVAGMRFPNRIGLAAGMDKHASCVPAWQSLGFGFAELGTVTAEPQAGNPKPRLFRIPEHRSLLNSQGFNNPGAEAVAANLRRLREQGKVRIPLGVNLGKSRKVDPEDEEAVLADYGTTVSILGPLADYLALNVSSPNTPGLRDWQEPHRLERLLGYVGTRTDKPVLLKLSPDLDEAQLEPLLEVARESSLAGIIATNTTLSRREAPAWTTTQAGGISGELLRQRASQLCGWLAARKPPHLSLISVGGIASPADVRERLEMGADLVQLYTALVFQGPDLIRRLAAADR